MLDKQTEILHINPIHPEPALIERAAALLQAGELVVFPTETVYGLGADALQVHAVERVFAAKGRPFSDPLIVHIADESVLETLAEEVPLQARRLAQAFWPGPLTLVLPASKHVSKLVTAGLPSVAIRMPRHPVAQALIRAAGSPIAAPSANRFMHISPTVAQHVLSDLGGRVPLILDGGPCEVGVESTVLDLSSAIPTLLRPGGVSLEALRTVLPGVQLQQRTAQKGALSEEEEAQKSPGQLPTHYSPSVPTYLFEGSIEAMRAAMQAEVRRRQEQGEQTGVLLADDDLGVFQESGAHIYSLGNTPEQIASRLYAGLRTLEESGVQVILCRSFDQQGLGLAVRDRLLKAAGGKVIRE